MSRYKIWSLDDIKLEIHKLEMKSGFYLEDSVDIKINNRLKRTLAQCRLDKKDKKIKVVSLEFSKHLIDGTVCEFEVIDTIIHEFAHAKREFGTMRKLYECSHDSTWKDICIQLGGTGNEYYTGNEFSYKKSDNKTMIIRCKECGKKYTICDMTIGSVIENKYHCTVCNGRFDVLKDISTNEKRIKIIKKFVKDELLGNNRGELRISNLGNKYRLLNVKNSSLAKLRISYKNNMFKIQIQDKLKNSYLEESKIFTSMVYDMYRYLNNKNIFKFIDNASLNKCENGYSINFHLNIKNLKLNEI